LGKIKQSLVKMNKDRLLRYFENLNKHPVDVPRLGDVLKLWDYKEVLEVHCNLEFMNLSINKLNFVPENF